MKVGVIQTVGTINPDGWHDVSIINNSHSSGEAFAKDTSEVICSLSFSSSSSSASCYVVVVAATAAAAAVM